MPKVPAAHLEARRQQIVDAALRCFARRGIHAAGMAEICQEAGLSPGAVYRYFAGKADIVDAAFDAWAARLGDLWSALHEAPDVLPAMVELLEGAFAWFDDPAQAESMRQGVLLHAEALLDARIAEKSAELHRLALDQLVGVVRRAQAQGGLNPTLDPTALARLLLAIYDGYRFQKISEPDLDPGPYVALIRQLLAGERLGRP